MEPTPRCAVTQISAPVPNSPAMVSFTPGKTYGAAVISTPEVQSGKTYTLQSGSSTTSVEMTNTIYGSGSGMNMGGGGAMGNRPGGGMGGNPGNRGAAM